MMMHQEGREQKRIKLEDSSTITHSEHHQFLSTHVGEGEEERRPLCWYGFYCNRKNDSAHVKRYRHPSSKEEEDLMQKNARDQEEQKLGIEVASPPTEQQSFRIQIGVFEGRGASA